MSVRTSLPLNDSLTLPFDPTKGMIVRALMVDDHTVIATFPVAQLLTLVPDPSASEDPRRLADDPTLAEYAALRADAQRAVEGAKKRNAEKYARYLEEGLKGQRPSWVVPPITLFHRDKLQVLEIGDGSAFVTIPWTDFLVAIDGETQRLAWQKVVKFVPEAKARLVSVVIHHGRDVGFARQAFHDLNVLEVKPNAAVAISMDTLDLATRIARELASESEVLIERGVNVKRRQLRRSDQEAMTISGLRTGVVTTILGRAGIQVGSRPLAGVLAEGSNEDAIRDAVIEVWKEILDILDDEFDPKRREESVASAPSILAGIGIVAHHTLPVPPRDQDAVEEWTVDDVTELLSSVDWSRQTGEGEQTDFPWDGIAGKQAASSGRFSVGGPKEVGHSIADALEKPKSEAGRRIRHK